MIRCRSGFRRWAVLVGALAFLAQGAPPPLARITLRKFSRHIRATGSVQPVEAVTVQVPEIVDSGGNLVLTKIVSSGTVVQPGDVVAEFDRTRLLDQARDAKAKYEDLQHQVEQRKAQHRSDSERRASELQQADAELAKARLELRKGLLLSDIDRLKAETKLDVAGRHVASLKKTIAARQQADTADRTILELQRDRQKVAMERAQDNAAKLQIRAPIAGMAAQEVVWRRGGPGNPQEGDQLWSGQSLLRIFSATDMEIQLTVGEPDGAALKPGTRAAVRLDAYPALEFSAVFQSAAPVAASLVDSDIRTFLARFRLEGRDPHLLPDLSAAVDLEAGTDRPVLAAPRAAIWYRKGRPYLIRVGPDGSRREVAVSLGLFDDSFVEVRDGLSEGDQVLAR